MTFVQLDFIPIYENVISYIVIQGMPEQQNVNTIIKAADILKSMTVRIGSDQFGGDLGTINGRASDLHIVLHHRQVEPSIVENFGYGRVADQAPQVWRTVIRQSIVGRTAELN